MCDNVHLLEGVSFVCGGTITPTYKYEDMGITAVKTNTAIEDLLPGNKETLFKDSAGTKFVTFRLGILNKQETIKALEQVTCPACVSYIQKHS